MIIDITNGDASGVAYWKAERFLVKWTTTAAEITFAYQDGSEAVEVAKYQTANGGVIIDITDFVRAYPERNLLLFGDGGTTVRGVIFSVAGLINPAGVLVPECDYSTYALIVPPLRMLSSSETQNAICFEFYKKTANTFTMDEYAENTLLNTSQIGNGSVYLNDTIVTMFRIENDDTGEHIERRLVEWECGKRYALVEWQSFTGATRRHVFEIVKQTNETNETIALENVQNEYTEIKGQTDGFSLRLEDLTRYDLWYYSDLITSSNVRVSIDGGVTYYRVQVTEKKYTIPDTDAGRLSTLEIPIKFRKYDTL